MENYECAKCGCKHFYVDYTRQKTRLYTAEKTLQELWHCYLDKRSNSKLSKE